MVGGRAGYWLVACGTTGGGRMRRNALVIGALVAAVAFTLLARNVASVNGWGTAGEGGLAAGPGQGGQARPGGSGSGSGGGGVDPDSFFTPTRLRPGERPPQFI